MCEERAGKREKERERKKQAGIARDDAQAVSLNVAAFDIQREGEEGGRTTAKAERDLCHL